MALYKTHFYIELQVVFCVRIIGTTDANLTKVLC